MRPFALALILASLAAPAFAADYLQELPGQVFTTTGSAAAIAGRARICVGQQLASGVAGGQASLADDGRTVVAANALRYRDGALEWQARSRVTIEARDGRFRISQSGLERFNDVGGGWQPIGKWWGSGWVKAATAFQAVTDDLAQCIAQPPAAEAW